MEASQNQLFQSPAGDSPPASASAASATAGKYKLTDEVKSKIGHSQDLVSRPARSRSTSDLSSESESELTKKTGSLTGIKKSQNAEEQDPAKSLMVKPEFKCPLRDMDKKKWKSLSDLSSGSDSEDPRLTASLAPHRKSSRSKRKRSQQDGAGLPQPIACSTAAAVQNVPQTITSRLAEILGTDVDYLQVWKSSELRETIHKNKLIKSISHCCHTWECKIPVEVFKKSDVTTHFYLLPNVGDQMQKAELRVQAKVTKSLFNRIKGYYQNCWIVVKSEVLDQRAGKELGYRDLHPQLIDPTKDGTVNFTHDLVLCEPLSESKSHSIDIVIKVIFVAQEPKGCIEEKGEDDWSVISHI